MDKITGAEYADHQRNSHFDDKCHVLPQNIVKLLIFANLMAYFSDSYSKNESAHPGILTLKRKQMEHSCDDAKIFRKPQKVTEKN